MKSRRSKTNSDSLEWKTKVFSAYSHMIEYNAISPNLYLVLIVLEWLQLLYFPFAYPQKADNLYEYISRAFEIPLYTQFLNYALGETSVFVCWVINCVIVVGTLALSLTVMLVYAASPEKPSFIGRFMYKTVGALCVLQNTVLFLPGTYCFLAIAFCVVGSQCWQGAYLGLAIGSLFVILMYQSLLHLAVFFEDYYVGSKLAWARATTSPATTKQLIKFLLVLLMTLDSGYSYASYTHPLLVILFGVHAYQQVCGLHYHSDTVNFVECVSTSNVFFSFLFTYIINLAGATVRIDSGLIVFVVSLMLGIVLYKYQESCTSSVIEAGFPIATEETQAINAIVKLASMAERAQKDPEAFCLFLGVLSAHREACKKSACPCEAIETGVRESQFCDANSTTNSKNYSGVESSGYGSEHSSGGQLSDSLHSTPQLNLDRTEQKGTKVDPSRLWQTFIGVILDGMLDRYPKSVTLHIIVAYYQEIVDRNFYKSFFNLVKASEKDCNHGQQLAIYRMKMVLDREIMLAENDKLSKDLEIDISVFLHFEEMRRVLDFAMIDTNQKVMQFWGLLLSTNLKIDKMYVIGGLISNAMKKTYSTFNQIVQIFPDHIKTYITYSDFLRHVANSEIEADEYQDRAEQIRRNLNFGRRQAFSDDGSFSVNRENAIVMVSGNVDTLGIVTNVNEYVHDIFGYTYNEIVGLSINVIIPKVVAASHDKYLMHFFQTGVPHVLDREGLFFGQCKSSLLIPLAVLIRTMPGLNEGLRYVAFIRRDMSYIKKTFITFPYKYNKSSKINFIMTTTSGKIIGLTERAAHTLGVPKEYFEKKKGLFISPLNIQRLNLELRTGGCEEELSKGMVLTLNFKPVYDVLDKDFLNPEDLQAFDGRHHNLDVFIQLTKYEFSCNVKYNIYAFVNMKYAQGSDAQAKDEQKNKLSSDDEGNALDLFGDNASSSAASSVNQNDKMKTLMKELKKNMFEQKESRNIVMLKRIIYVSVLALLALSITDFVYYLFKLDDVDNIFDLDRASNKRRNLLTTSVGEFQSYLGLSTGTEPNVSAYESDRTTTLKSRLLGVLEDLKNNEYIFQDQLKNALLDSISSQGLTSTMIQYSSLASRLLNEVTLDKLNTSFVRALCSNGKIVGKFTGLTQAEKDTYFILTNGLYNTINASTKIVESIDGFLDDSLHSGRVNYLIVHSIQFFVSVLVMVIAVPFIRKVQSSKREVLKLFAEIPRKKIVDLLKDCEDFNLRQQLLDDPHSAERNKKNEAKLDKEKRLEYGSDYGEPSSATPPPAPHSELETHMRSTEKTDTLTPLQNGGNGERKKQEDNSNTNANENYDAAWGGSPEEKQKENEGKPDTDAHIEDRFKDERKKKFRKYKAEIGIIFLIMFSSVFAIAGFNGGILAFQVKGDGYFVDNYRLLAAFQKRWFHMAAVIVYLQASTTSVQIVDELSSSGITKFIGYSRAAFDIENEINDMYSNHPYNQNPVATIIYALVNGNLCTEFYARGVLNSSELTPTLCESLNNMLLDYGLNMVISYLLTDFKQMYVNITSGVGAEQAAETADKLLFERVLVPGYDYLIAQASNAKSDFMYLCVVLFSVLFGCQVLVMIIVLTVLLECFIGTLNNELWNAKGIVTLLPFDIIMSTKEIREMFSKQMNIIV